jgi:hypothetical protein
MWPSLLSSCKPHVRGSVPRSLGQQAPPSTMLPQGCFWCAQLPHSQKNLFLAIGKSTGALSCAETELRDCCRLTGSSWPRHPSPAFSQGSQLFSAAVHLTGKHTELQTGLKGKQKTAICPHSFYCVSPLASSALMFQPSWAGRGSWDWATGKEPRFIRVTSPPEVAE